MSSKPERKLHLLRSIDMIVGNFISIAICSQENFLTNNRDLNLSPSDHRFY
jgi:hypothetical protein